MENNIYKNSAVHYITKYTIDIMFYIGILCVAALPFVSPLIKTYIPSSERDFTVFMITLALSGVCALYILFTFKKMFKTLLSGNPFARENISCFRKLAVACAAVSLIYLISCLSSFTFGRLTVSVAFALGCLFCLTLKDIFKQAMLYKEENDLTV